MSVSVHTLFDKITPRPSHRLFLDPRLASSSFPLGKKRKKILRTASFNACSSKKHFKKIQGSITDGIDGFAHELAKSKKTGIDEAKHLIEHKPVTLHGMFDAIVP